jgi:hypothetical protein
MANDPVIDVDDRMAMLLRDFADKQDVLRADFIAKTTVGEARRQEADTRRDAEHDALWDTSRALHEANDQRAPAGGNVVGAAAGKSVDASAHALAKHNRDDHKTGESHFNANAFDDQDRFDNIKSLEEHKAIYIFFPNFRHPDGWCSFFMWIVH